MKSSSTVQSFIVGVKQLWTLGGHYRLTLGGHSVQVDTRWTLGGH